MHLHDEISRIVEMDGISRVDVQGFALADDFSQITREVAFVGVETSIDQDESRLPSVTRRARYRQSHEGGGSFRPLQIFAAKIETTDIKGRKKTIRIYSTSGKAIENEIYRLKINGMNPKEDGSSFEKVSTPMDEGAYYKKLEKLGLVNGVGISTKTVK